MSTAIRLLILEDDAYDAELQVAMLKEAGYDCQWERVETQAEFLACLDAPDYDLILADYNLPTFDGLTALKLFLERDLDLPFILVSGTLGEETAIESLKAGATDYVLKGRLSRLGPVVRRALREQEEHRQRKRAEEALRESEEKYRTLVEHSLQGLVVIQDFGIVFANAAFAEISGYTVEELLSLSPEEVKAMVHPEDQALVWGRFRDRLTGKPVPPRYEYRGIRKDGAVRWLEMFASRIEYHGKPAIQGAIIDITERKRAEEALRESEALLNKSQAIAHIGSWELDLFANRLTWSDEVYRMFGLRPQEFDATYEAFLDTVHPDDRAAVDAAYSGSLREGRDTYEIEHRIVRRDSGEVRVVHEKCEHVKDASGRIVRSVGMVQDITERKRAEEALRRSEQEKAAILETMSEHVVYQDTKNKVLWANRAASESVGLTPEQLVGRHCYEIWQQRSKLCIGCPVVKARETGQPQEAEITTPDGRVWFIRGYPVRDANGDIGGMVEITLEITERKRAERLLRTLNAAALAMERALTLEEIFVTVAEELKKLGFSCMVFPTDESQSRLFTEHLGYETRALKAVEKLVGLQHEDFSIPIETVDIYRQVVWEKKTVFVENAEEIVWQVLPDFAKRFAGQIGKMLKIPKSIAAPLIVEDQVIGVLSVQSDDLTQDDMPAIIAFAHQMAAAWRKAQLMQDLQSSLEELKQTQAQLVQAQKMEAIGQLAAGIAHDFNNLLTPIGGFTELLLGKAPEGSQQREHLRQIHLAAKRAAALTRQLRLFTRQARGERRPVQLNSVVEETRDLLERSIPKDISIELGLASELWAVEGDPSQIGQVLMNLCLNACDAMPDGGTLTMETRNVTLDEEYARAVLEAQPGRYVCLSVLDTGCGMSPEVQARLFEPFFTTKGMGEGTGLGLAVVYGIVKGHGGFIQVYSQEGRGSTFHVYLPAIEWAVKETEVEELDLPTGTETILLVDDEKMVRALGQRVLELCGYTVLMAEDGLQALEVYQAHQGKIDLVVLDVIMPQMGGLECLRRLREMDPRVKVLISTGYTARGLAEELVAEGALGVVEKPFRLQDFATAVRAALDRDPKGFQNP